MTVAYPRKLHNKMSARDILKRVVGDRQIHLITLNRYRYNEQRSCKDLTNLIETLNGKPKELVQDLSHHVAVEAAKRKYAAIEHAAYECGMDILAGAELRRLNNLLEITKTMPVWVLAIIRD